MNRVRYLVIVVLAAVVTSGVFYFMQSLIAGAPGVAQAAAPPPAIHFGPVELPDDPPPRRPPPKPPEPPKTPPPPKHTIVTDQPPEPERIVDRFKLHKGVDGDSVRDSDRLPPTLRSEGEIVVILATQPHFPPAAVLKNIEGRVKVEFVITPAGTVREPRVVESTPPGVFDKEAVRAILKWRFKPRVVDGQAVERRATQVFDFKLDAEA